MGVMASSDAGDNESSEYILAIETTGAFASVALAKPGAPGMMARVMAKVNGRDRFSHLQNLTPQIQQVLEDTTEAEGRKFKGLKPLSINDVSLVAVSRGPGSFTGIRIGVSTARALAQALDIPCVGVSSLEALAMRVCSGTRFPKDSRKNYSFTPSVPGIKTGWDITQDTLICPILDARRSQIYGGGYFIKDGFPVSRIEAGPYTIDEFMELIRGYDKVCFLGDGIDSYGDKIVALRPEGTGFAPKEMRYQDAGHIARLGYHMAKQGETTEFSQLKPEYMRLAEAERKLNAERKLEEARKQEAAQNG